MASKLGVSVLSCIATMLAWAAVGRADTASAPHLLVIPLPGGTSHQMQSLAIARALRGRGWRTTAVLADFDEAGLGRRGLLDPELETVVFSTPPNTNDDFQRVIAEAQSKPKDYIRLHTTHFEGMCRTVLSDGAMLTAMRGVRADLLLLDVSYTCASAIIEILGMPRFVLFGPVDIVDPLWSEMAGLPHSPAVHTFLGSGLAHPLPFHLRAVNALLSPVVSTLGWRLVSGSVERMARDFNLTGMRVVDMFRSSQLMLVNSVPGLGPPRSLPPKVKGVGPLLIACEPEPLPDNLEGILEAAGPQGIVYISLGTTFHPTSCDLAGGIMHAVAALRHTVVLNIRPDTFPEGCPLASFSLPPSVHILPWVPQSDLLAHPRLKAFVSHGGINSVLEAAYRGKPMVCVPLGADQFDNCAKAASGGWAQVLRSSELSVASAPRLAEMIAAAAADSSPYLSAVTRVSAVLRAHPRHPLDQAADLMEYALALPRGVDLSDPATSLPWWQRQCVDVYALAAVVLLALLAGTDRLARAAGRALLRAGRRGTRRGKQD